ncbi:sigma-E processing peptidase SpoIIGA [Paenibacillus sp. GCM10023252]|uniref:sigma-E processing peptidase SpoIIGA n=1 Tax=Paenibacillus sp. GCM10023252 TaxID=3252649 RepID=UPI00361A7A3A
MYIDIVFLKEMLVDGGVLLTTAWVRHTRANPWRIVGAAAIGACYVVLLFFPPLSFLFTIGVKVLISLVMLWAAFGYHSLQHYLRNLGAFYAVNFVAAGAILGVHYLLIQGSSNLWRTMVFTEDGVQTNLKLGIFVVFAAMCIGLYLYRSVASGRRERDLIQSHLAEVNVIIHETRFHCVGLVDTGNQLYDPLTRTPVMVMEASIWSEQLPPAWLQLIRDSQVDRLVAGMDEDDFIWQDRLRLVPYRGVNRGSQFMLALKPDSVLIEREGKPYETRKVLIGLDGGRLSTDGSYQAIIHPSLVAARAD